MSLQNMEPADLFGFALNVLLGLSFVSLLISLPTFLLLKIVYRLRSHGGVHKSTKIIGWVFVLSLTTAFLTFFVRSMPLSGPPVAYRWYEHRIVVDQQTLPTGMEVGEIRDPYQDYGVKNSSSEPFYLVYYKNDEGWEFSSIFPEFKIKNQGISYTYRLRFKLVNGEILECDKKGSGKNQTCEWRNPSAARDSKRNLLNLFGNSLVAVEGGVKGFSENTPPLPDAPLPAPQPFIIHGLYKGNLWDIKGTISYYPKPGGAETTF